MMIFSSAQKLKMYIEENTVREGKCLIWKGNCNPSGEPFVPSHWFGTKVLRKAIFAGEKAKECRNPLSTCGNLHCVEVAHLVAHPMHYKPFRPKKKKEEVLKNKPNYKENMIIAMWLYGCDMKTINKRFGNTMHEVLELLGNSGILNKTEYNL